MIDEEINHWYLSNEKKVARNRNKEKSDKERDRWEMTPYLIGTYKVRQITEMKKIKHPQLRKVNMFEIYNNHKQKPKFIPTTVFKGKQNIFYRHKAELSSLINSLINSFNNLFKFSFNNKIIDIMINDSINLFYFYLSSNHNIVQFEKPSRN
jgi:hypothetical protein